jgi:hypothetical protein
LLAHDPRGFRLRGGVQVAGRGVGDDPEGLLADCVRIDLEMELLAEVTRVAWDEARPKAQRKKKR